MSRAVLVETGTYDYEIWVLEAFFLRYRLMLPVLLPSLIFLSELFSLGCLS